MMEVVKDPGNDQNQFFIDLVNEYQGMLLHMCYVYLRDSKSTQLIVSRQTKPEDVTPAFSFYSLFIPCLSLNDRNYVLFLQNFI